MELDRETCNRARRSRDPRFDGRFFICVTTTGIYCRSICPSRSSKDEHVLYVASAPAAQAAGFRPCLRCRPEASPGTPAWRGTMSVVSRALRLIGEGALDEDGVDALAERLGVTARHLGRLFAKHLGATPVDVAMTRRLHFAKKLVDETTLPFDEVAFAAGYGSVRRFNGEIRRTFARTPTELRRLARRDGASSAGCFRFHLAYRPPYDWAAAMRSMAAQATGSVEHAEPDRYLRSIEVDGKVGTIVVVHAAHGHALELEVRFPDPRALLLIVERVRSMFDLAADPAVIADHLRLDPLLREPLASHEGIRCVRQAWDGFELAVLTVLGDAAAARRVAEAFGPPVDHGPIERAFPGSSLLQDAPLERAGVEASKAEAIRALARCVTQGTVQFGGGDPSVLASALISAARVDPRLARRIAGRLFDEPDAFDAHDPRLRLAAGGLKAARLEARSKAWRPWRAYAAMLLMQEGDHLHEKARDGSASGDDRRRGGPVRRRDRVQGREAP